MGRKDLSSLLRIKSTDEFIELARLHASRSPLLAYANLEQVAENSIVHVAYKFPLNPYS